jgi:hypothetical protein
MHNYPRNSKSRADALAGSGHIGNHSAGTFQEKQDRLLRENPGLDLSTVLVEYGGTKTTNVTDPV